MSNSHTKFGWISPNSLRGNSIRTDRQMDGGDCNIPFAFLKKGGDKYGEKKDVPLFTITMLQSFTRPTSHISSWIELTVSKF